MIEPVFFPGASDFRKWLDKHHKSATELWVGFHKRATGKPSMTWPESVDQALCYGWIDGIRKSIDDTAYMIWFSPRRPHSIWSAANLKKFDALKSKGRVKPAGQAVFQLRKKKDTNRYSFEQGSMELPPEFLKLIRANKKAWKFFQSLTPSVRKPSVWYVLSAKKEETRLKRLNILISSCEQEERIPPLRISKKG